MQFFYEETQAHGFFISPSLGTLAHRPAPHSKPPCLPLNPSCPSVGFTNSLGAIGSVNK